MLQVSDSHEGFVEVVQLQNAGQQEEARDQDTAEEFRQSERLQTNCCQPGDNRGEQDYTLIISILWKFLFEEDMAVSSFSKTTYCSSVKPVKFRQYSGKSSNWYV